MLQNIVQLVLSLLESNANDHEGLRLLGIGLVATHKLVTWDATVLSLVGSKLSTQLTQLRHPAKLQRATMALVAQCVVLLGVQMTIAMFERSEGGLGTILECCFLRHAGQCLRL